ncbi:NAD(P)-binding protein [Aureobasidium pullulans]|uniref:NAD(P)-binding protein n=1 Tax=Aureobasidium pullulans TaxID=5580 RepID=A0A4S9YGE9_AURPU|nr:NAD(P)-binding protein [Aureobasidium pullulans]THZ90354.1 NAD(P)-binding protein [Aureobasidium pullulans]
MAPNIFAVIAGVGPGTGAAVVRKFAQAYPVVLLARKEESYSSLVKEINEAGGSALGVATDVSVGSSITAAFEKIKAKFGSDATCAVIKKPFLELTEDDFTKPYAVSGKGAFHFSQAVLPHLLASAATTPKYNPTLIFTGATAALKGSAGFSTFASAKFAQRALAQSLAREFAPQGIHVSHVIIDGVIDIPSSKEYLKDAGPNAKINTEAIAEAYWQLHTQHLSAMTHEIEIRPFIEKW